VFYLISRSLNPLSGVVERRRVVRRVRTLDHRVDIPIRACWPWTHPLSAMVSPTHFARQPTVYFVVDHSSNHCLPLAFAEVCVSAMSGDTALLNASKTFLPVMQYSTRSESNRVDLSQQANLQALTLRTSLTMLHVGDTGVGTLLQQPFRFVGLVRDSGRGVRFLSPKGLVNIRLQSLANFAAHPVLLGTCASETSVLYAPFGIGGVPRQFSPG